MIRYMPSGLTMPPAGGAHVVPEKSVLRSRWHGFLVPPRLLHDSGVFSERRLQGAMDFLTEAKNYLDSDLQICEWD